MEKLQRNQKYPGKFSIQIDSLKNTSFDAQLYYADKDFIEMEVSYSSSLVETVELTNFIEHTFDFYDVQGFIFIGSKKHNISLLHCSLNSDNWVESFDSKDKCKNFHKKYIRINIGAYILDAKIDSHSKLCKAEFQFSALSMWADLLKAETKENKLSVDKKLVWNTTSDNGDELLLKNYFEEEKKNNQISYIQTASLEINFKEAKTFSDFLDYGRIYNDFFVLMTGRKSDIEKFLLTVENSNKSYEVFVNYKSCNPEFTEKSYFHFEYLTHNLSALKNWYSSYKNTNLAYTLFFDTYHFKERYMTDMLLDALVRSFEGMITKYFYRNRYFISRSKNKRITDDIKNEFESKIETVLTKYQSEIYKIENYLDKYRQTLLESFSHSYELSFRVRINLFFDIHKEHFENDFKDYDKNEIIKQMLSFRNAYAHADDSKLSNNNIFTLLRFTKKMILVHLYSDILNNKEFYINIKEIL